MQTAWHLYDQLRASPKHWLRSCVQEALFPNCSFQAPCNGWTICNNFRGKAITRARDIIEMYHHRNRIQDTCVWQMHAALARQRICSNAAGSAEALPQAATILKLSHICTARDGKDASC